MSWCQPLRPPLRFVTQLFTLLALAFTLISVPAPVARASDPIPVVVTIPVLRDWVERIGGPHVRVTTLIKGLESEHSYSPRPSDLMAVRKAKLLVEVGVGLEIWVSGLVRSANNPSLLLVTTAKGIPLLPDRASSPATSPDHPPAGAAPTETSDHEHESGSNPHVWLDPENAATMIRHITDALSQTDPPHAAEFRRSQAVYLQELDRARTELLDQVRKLPDRRLIVHHPAWPYFAKRFGLEIVGEIQIVDIRPERLILLKQGPRDIASRDTFYRQRLRFLGKHGSTAQLRVRGRESLRDDRVIDGDDVVWAYVSQFLEPEGAHLV